MDAQQENQIEEDKGIKSQEMRARNQRKKYVTLWDLHSCPDNIKSLSSCRRGESE